MLAALLSLFLPGAGQLYLGRRRRGLLFASVSLVLVGLLVWTVTRGPALLLRLAVRPDVLLALLAVNGAVLLFRAVAVFDAFRLGRVSGHGWLARASLVGLLVLTMMPHLGAGYYDLYAYSALTDVFAGDEAAARPAAFGPDADPFPEVSLQLGRDDAAERAREIGLWDRRVRTNVLLLGGDAGPGRSGVRTDTLIVASFEPSTGRSVLFGIPRNFVQVPLPDGSEFPEPINALYRYGSARPWLFPGSDPGASAVKAAAGELLGLRIHYFAFVDLRGFVEVIDALGGVTITLRYGMHGFYSSSDHYGYERYDLDAGRHHVDGRTALAYVRTRQGDSDYARMSRQRCLLHWVARELDVTSLAFGFPRIARALRDSVTTDIPIEEVPGLLDVALQVNPRRTIAVGLTAPRYAGGVNERRYPTPNVGLIQATVDQTFLKTPRQLAETFGTQILGRDCR